MVLFDQRAFNDVGVFQETSETMTTDDQAPHLPVIVSSDEDLLSLHPFRGIPIVTPRQFLDDAWKKLIGGMQK
jgi:hypothetical protein